MADMIAWNVHRLYIERCEGREHDTETWRALKEVPVLFNDILSGKDLLAASAIK